MAPKRVALRNIKSLTFRSDAQTTARRTDPIPQLQCHGKACRRYQPDVVQCQNMGDDGAGSVQWKCDADLPEGMRFGRVEVSCEGWTRSGDTNVLQGSCGLSYDLVTIDPALERPEHDPFPPYRLGQTSADELISTISQTIAVLTTLFVLYKLLRNLVDWARRRMGGGSPSRPGGGGGGGGGGPGGGGDDDAGPPPPPYTKQPTGPPSYPPGTPSNTQDTGAGPDGRGQAGFNPGFWTGLAAGGAATYLFNRRTNQPGLTLRDEDGRRREGTRVDWGDMDDDRGVGPSTRGGGSSMRRATAFGSTSTR